MTSLPSEVDVAVIGVPNEDFGEEVKAIVQPAAREAAGPDLADELLEYCRSQLAGYKCPRSFEFVPTVGRTPMGKVNKRTLRAPWWHTTTAG